MGGKLCQIYIKWTLCVFHCCWSTTMKCSGFSFWQKLPTKFKKFYAEFESMMVSCMKLYIYQHSCGTKLHTYSSFNTRDNPTSPRVQNLSETVYLFGDRTHRETTGPTDSLSPNWNHQSSPSCPSFSKVQHVSLLRIPQSLYHVSMNSERDWIIFFTDMTFTHEGNKTFIDSMVNFEKMVSLCARWMINFMDIFHVSCTFFTQDWCNI